MPRSPLSLLFVLALLPTALPAQWRVGLEAGVDRVPRLATPLEAESPGLRARPEMTWPLALRGERGGAGLRFGATASLVQAGLELDDGGFGVVVRPGFEILTLAPEVSYPLRRLAGEGAIRVHLAVPLERWSFPSTIDDARWRIGAAAGLAAEFPLAERLTLRAAVQAGRVFRNPIADSEMTDEYEMTAMWRRGARLGMAWQL